MNEENDESIKVTIRTGTSTRRPIPSTRPRTASSIPDPFLYRTLFGLLSAQDSGLERLLERSLNEGGLRKDPTIHLDIPVRFFKDSDKGQNCPICQSEYKEGDELTHLSRCGHTFHYNCLQEWGKYKQECPLCRDSIPTIPDLETI